jgi:hypothetical protein
MDFFRRYVLAGIVLFVGPAITVGSLLLHAYTVRELGLPVEVWVAIGLAIFFLSVIGILFRWHEEHRASSNAVSTPLSSSEGRISIISPLNGGLLDEGRRPHGGGCSYLIRIRLTHLPEGHKIWVLNEDEVSGKVWPQSQAVRSLRPSEWEGETFVWPKQTKITIVAVVAPPTSHEYFQYYHKFREHADRINRAVTQAIDNKAASIELRSEDREVLPLVRLPPECTNIARVQARQIGREAT